MDETQGRHLYGIALVSIVALSIFGGAALYMSYRLTLAQPSEKNTILVTGTGSVFPSPDVASFTATIATNASNAAQAAELNTETTNKVVSALKNASSFYRVDVKSVHLFVSGSLDSSSYLATRDLIIVIEDTYALSRLIDIALSNGATSVYDISYDFSQAKLQQADAEATRLAIDNAYKKAKQMADNMGVQLGPPTIAKISANTLGAGPSASQTSGPQQIEYVVDVEISYTFT
jgi:uncharacterized protein YggE